MTTFQITVDETVAEAVRRRAQAEGKTVETWAAEVVARQAAESVHWVDRFLEIADKAGGDSRGQKWSREELYDR